FYSVSNWQFVALLLGSIAFNYFIGYLLIAKKLSPSGRSAALTLGVAGDLLLLGIFKYAGFFAANVNALFATDFTVNILLMFGIFLPLNFNSPYKATSIIDFWRRWHMTLSQFLRDYLYIPLGGDRRGPALRYFNLMITMLLGGLSHGAAWTFVVWGALHGACLCVNHAWNNYGPNIAPRFARAADVGGLILTFLAVVVAWVFFRADNMAGALYVLSKMSDPGNIAFGRAEIIYVLFIAGYA